MWWFCNNKVHSASVEYKQSAFALVCTLVIVVAVLLILVVLVILVIKIQLSVNCILDTAKHFIYIIIFNSQSSMR